MNQFNENRAVGQLSELLALECGYSPAESKQIRTAAVLHDCGKQFIDEKILNKPGKLDKWEYEIMKTHTKLGAKMLSSIQGELGKKARLIFEFHHEWENGKGYRGIPAYHLPDYVPIVAISDVYTSLISKRPYKNTWLPEDTLSYIQSQAGTQFNAVL